ncbi:MAG: threonine--tRNA ligase [Endomicrobium sp.]|jgi:threonyl-tRNA synthetase|nr:threonine--tRNA ligase [Endomicrobium sp.]
MKDKNKDELNTLRHSAAHIMAAAVKKILGNKVKFAIGPAIENGFYYDFDIIKPFTYNELIKIENIMNEIISCDFPFVQSYISKENAISFFKKNNEKYKIEILSKIKDDIVSIYKCGDFVDLCKGPHISSTGKLSFFKLLSVAGSYWQGNSSTKQLQRIYGTAFLKKENLDSHLNFLSKVKDRDHRKLGKALELFNISDIIGSGLILWLPNGAVLKNTIENFLRKLCIENSYSFLSTPHIANDTLFSISGHLETYKENMYPPIMSKNISYHVKPMNCPMHLLVYKTKLHSYKDLPIRYAELGTVYRFEKSGVLHGLLRARGFTQDDGHIIITPEQLTNEILKILKMATNCLKVFGFCEYKIYFATMPKNKYIGNISDWNIAQNIIENTLKTNNYPYDIDDGGGAFYGPKIDIKIKDSIGRLWQCSTIQLDFNLPQRFNIFYVDRFGNKKRPYLIHRALVGSIERFIGILLEHYAGEFPFWLSPVQVAILTIDDKQKDYCNIIYKKLNKYNIRVFSNTKKEDLRNKIKQCIINKVPYMIIIGEKEKLNKLISVKTRKNIDLGSMKIENFISLVQHK